MPDAHLIFLVEEESTETFLREFLKIQLPDYAPVIHHYQGRGDLLNKLEGILRGYASWLPEGWRIFVMVDRDRDDCYELKGRLEYTADRAGLLTRARSSTDAWQVVNRIVIEELEAWYFGDPLAVCQAYPGVKPNTLNQARYRNPDTIEGGTWEALERVLQRSGCFRGIRLPKGVVARKIAPYISPERNRSHSFQVFYSAVVEATEIA